MALCGFDEQRLEGLEKFHFGLIKNAVNRMEKVDKTEDCIGGTE